MPKIKFSFTVNIDQKEIERYTKENFMPVMSDDSKELITTQMLAIQIFEQELRSENLKARDFKIRIHEQ